MILWWREHDIVLYLNDFVLSQDDIVLPDHDFMRRAHDFVLYLDDFEVTGRRRQRPAVRRFRRRGRR
jgi:hypothetical protein